MNDQESRRAKRASLVLCLCFAVAACGGGAVDTPVDGAAPVSAPLANAAPMSAPLASAAPVSAPLASAPPVQAAVPASLITSTGIDASCGLNGSGGFEAEVLQRVNALRAAGAVCGTTIYAAAAPLNWNNLLQQAATGHSSDMAKNNYFSHDSLDGKTFAQRLTDAGYYYSAAGENIAANDATVEQVVNHWLNSPAHCVNMMNPIYRDIAVSCVRSDSATYSRYWTMDLGRS
jgi:uncharacterized protein YkwD